jgi:hypothetical protein
MWQIVEFAAGDSLHLEWHDGRLHAEYALVDPAASRAEAQVSMLSLELVKADVKQLHGQQTTRQSLQRRSDRQQMGVGMVHLPSALSHKGPLWPSTRASCCQRHNIGSVTPLAWCDS